MSNSWAVVGGWGKLRNAPLKLFLEKWSEDCVPRAFAKMKQQSVLSRLPGTTPDSCFTPLEEEGDWPIARCSINICWADVCLPVSHLFHHRTFVLDRFPLVKWGKHYQVRNACQAFPLTLVSIVFVTQGKFSLTVRKQNCPNGTTSTALDEPSFLSSGQIKMFSWVRPHCSCQNMWHLCSRMTLKCLSFHPQPWSLGHYFQSPC